MERKKHERNKRYGILILLLVLNWLAIAAMVYFVDPENVKDILFPSSYLPMTLLIMSGSFWIYTIIFMSAKRAIRWTLGTMLFLYLRIWGMGNLFNAILIFGLLSSWELYWWKTNTSQRLAQSEE